MSKLDMIYKVYDEIKVRLDDEAFDNWESTINSFIEHEYDFTVLEDATEMELRTLYIVMINKYKLLK